MEKKESKKSIYYIMRILHRDIGFLVIGLTLVYAFSGVTLIYRNTNFFKREKTTINQLNQNLEEVELAVQLGIRNFQIEKKEGDIIYFREGTYNTSTGIAEVSRVGYPHLLNEFVRLHKISGNNIWSLFFAIYGVLLLFLAISPLFMFKFGSSKSKRGFVLTGTGIVLTIILLLLF